MSETDKIHAEMFYIMGQTTSEIAEYFNVSTETIRRIVRA